MPRDQVGFGAQETTYICTLTKTLNMIIGLFANFYTSQIPHAGSSPIDNDLLVPTDLLLILSLSLSIICVLLVMGFLFNSACKIAALNG